MFTTFMLDVHLYKCRVSVLVGELFGNILIHCHRMPYDVEIENDVNVIAI